MNCYQCENEIVPDGMVYSDSDDNRICNDCFRGNMRAAGFMRATYFDRQGHTWS